jgi:hypothetical protein
LITAFFDRFFERLLRDAFAGVEPFSFVWGPALSPLKTELLGLKRNHARDEIKLSHLYEAWHLTAQYYFSAAPRRLPDPIICIERVQRRREMRMAEIEDKLKRDSRMGKCQ